MKKLFILTMLFAFSTAMFAQLNQTVKWPFGAAEYYDQSSFDTSGADVGEADVIVTDNLTVLDFGVDTNFTVNIETEYISAGDLLFMKIYADTNHTGGGAADRVISFGDNLTAEDETITNGKTEVFQFIWIGDSYQIVSAKQID